MPWLETAPMEQRERFIRDHQLALYTMTELSARYGISRKTGYKWLDRFDQGGREGLGDRSRAPQRCRHKITDEVATLICEARRRHPSWGPDFLLACHGLGSTKGIGVRPVFDRLFREYGLPAAIRTDNGVPFATTGIHGLSQLNVWWLRLGIQHQRSRPASPQDNGAHERMHKTLKHVRSLEDAWKRTGIQHVSGVHLDALCRQGGPTGRQSWGAGDVGFAGATRFFEKNGSRFLSIRSRILLTSPSYSSKAWGTRRRVRASCS